ncbi:MAG TPA: type II secretion system protein GspG [Candidatus Binataceae bacterium]|nr:type II secretion system protein GspG [Candidatus Binataceae bacterium]
MRTLVDRIPIAARIAVTGLAMLLVAALVVRAIARATEQAKVSRAEAEIAILKRALDRYYFDNGAYPTVLDALYNPTAHKSASGQIKYVGRYVSDLPEHDPWGNPFYYESDGQMYVLKSFGADGVPGGTGNNSDIVADANMTSSE